MAPIKQGCRYQWKFDCGHVMRQDDPIDSPKLSSLPFIPMEVAEDCVFCKHYRPHDKFTKTEAQIREQEQRALDIYEAQVETLEQHIEDAGDDASVVKNMEKLLEQCNLMWADEVKKIEQRENSTLVQPGHPDSLSQALQEKFNTALEKVKLLLKAENILLERARSPTYKGRLTAEILDIRVKKWTEYAAKIKDLKRKALGLGSWDNVIAAEDELEDDWADIVKLMSTK